MMHELRSIPPAPRRIRLRPLLAHRWPLLALGASLVVNGTLLAWFVFLYRSADLQLAAGPTVRVRGIVTRVETPIDWDGRAMERVHCRFEWRDAPREGISFVDADRCAVGDDTAIEVLATDDNVNRIVGGFVQQDRTWLRADFWLARIVVPGSLMLLGWLAGSFQLRQVLVHGDATVGRVLTIEEVRRVLPRMLRVRYEFRDHRAVLRRGGHWVRVNGELGARLQRQVRSGRFEPMPVLHDRRLPYWNRMILPQDFLPRGTHVTQPADGTA